MEKYLPAIIWMLGALIGYIVLRKRGVNYSQLWNIALVLAGPLAIPFACYARPNKADATHRC